MRTTVVLYVPGNSTCNSTKVEFTQFISHPTYRDENLKGSTVTARACLMGANLIDAGGLSIVRCGGVFV
jgi:hypothetical protein